MADKSSVPLWESRNGWQLRRLPLAAAAIIALATLVLLSPTVFEWLGEGRRVAALNAYSQQVELIPQAQRDDIVERAQKCNQSLVSTAYIVPGFATPQPSEGQLAPATDASEPVPKWDDAMSNECLDPVISDLASVPQVTSARGQAVSGSSAYDAVLNLGDGVLARLTVTSAGIDAAVYHGDGKESLRQGVGHVPWTSLPVGGTGTNSVLVGSGGTQFSALESVKSGDRFTLQVLGQTLAYQVESVELIQADQTVPLTPDPALDRVMLVTAAGHDILAEHLLVTADRVEATAEEISALEAPVVSPRFPWWTVIAFLVTLSLLAVLIYSAGRPPKEDNEDQEPGADQSSDWDGATGGRSSGGRGLGTRGTGARDLPSFANDPAFQEYVQNYRPDPRAEAEMMDDDDASYRNHR